MIPIPGLDVNACQNIRFPVNFSLRNKFPTLLDWYIEKFQRCWLNNRSIRLRLPVIIVVIKRMFKELKRKFDKHPVTYVPISNRQLKLEDAWKRKDIIVFTDGNGDGPPTVSSSGMAERIC